MKVLYTIFNLKGEIPINQELIPNLGGILKKIRIDKGLSQEKLADKISRDNTTISKVEAETMNCSYELLMEIKTALGIEWLPFYKSERKGFRNKLYLWHDVINESNLDVAKEMQKKLSYIEFIPDDIDLNTYYHLFNCKLLLATNKLESANCILETLEINLDKLNEIQLYYYYHNKGTWNIRNDYTKEALDFYLQACESAPPKMEKDIWLYYNISLCYKRLGMLSCSTAFLEKARNLYSNNPKNILAFHIDCFLAKNYIAIGQLYLAKKILDECYEKAKLNNKLELISQIMPTYGYMYRVNKDYDTAIEYLDKALSCLDENSELFMEALYQKILCLIETKRFTPCISLLEKGKDLSLKNETYSIMFESLRCLTRMTNPLSAKYIKDEAIEHMRENKLNYIALEYCHFLIQYYLPKGDRGQATARKISAMAYNFYKEMLEGCIVE